MAVPLSARDLEEFTPESLVNLPKPPVFLIRVAPHRAWINFQRALSRHPGLDRPLRHHDKDVLRRELIRGLETLWTGEAMLAAKGRIQETWAAIDQDQSPSDDDIDHMNELSDMVMKEWRPLREMAADNIEYFQDAPRIAIGMFVAGWNDFTLEYQREAGVIPLHIVDKVAEQLAEVEAEALKSAIAGVGAPGTAFAELSTRAFSVLGLTETERKNSSSLSPSSPIPEDSTTQSDGSTAAGSSKASASSRRKKTRLHV